MRPLLLVFVAIAVGCAAKASAPDVPTDEGTHDTPDPSADPPAKTTSDAGKPPPPPPPPPPPTDGGITKTEGGTSDAGDPTSIASLFPAVVGHSWTFQV